MTRTPSTATRPSSTAGSTATLGQSANDGAAGSGVIDVDDDCTLVGYDGTADGVTIPVVDGSFVDWSGPLPTVFNASAPNNPDIGDSDFAWSTINGLVDSNGNEVIDADGSDCSFNVVGTADILGNDAAGTDPCGFGPAEPEAADNGKVDLNSDGDITTADSCARCFLGHRVILGVVQQANCPGHVGDPRNQVVGTPGPDVLVGTAGADVICGLGGNDILTGKGGERSPARWERGRPSAGWRTGRHAQGWRWPRRSPWWIRQR